NRLEAVGLSTLMGCGDVPRVILGSPVAGVAEDEIIDATPAIETIVNEYLERDDVQNLPRKFKTAISGNARQDVTHENQDVSFVRANHTEYGPVLDSCVRGRLSTKPMRAQSNGAFVPLDRVPEVWHGVVSIFREYGFLRLRRC